MIRTPLSNVEHRVRGTRRQLKLPEGYRLDLANDPDVPALKRPDGVVVARFSAGGLTEEAIEHEAWADLLYGSELPRPHWNLVTCPSPT
jgi:hypothetical protein